MFICYFFILRAFSLFFMEFFVENIPLQSITILLCQVLRNTCPFITYYFAKYYVILAHLLRITLPSITLFFSHSKTQHISHKTEKA